MKTNLIVIICTLAAWSCTGGKRIKQYTLTEKVPSIDIFRLPLYTDDRSPEMDRFSLGVVRQNDSLWTMEVIPPSKKNSGLVFHYFIHEGVAGYYSEPYLLRGCLYSDSMLIGDQVVFFSKNCKNDKVNIKLEELAPDTVMVTKYFYYNTAIGATKSMAKRDSWSQGADETRIFYLIKGPRKMEYTCLQQSDKSCPVDFLNLGSGERPNSFFWHFIYVSHFSRN